MAQDKFCKFRIFIYEVYANIIVQVNLNRIYIAYALLYNLSRRAADKQIICDAYDLLYFVNANDALLTKRKNRFKKHCDKNKSNFKMNIYSIGKNPSFDT